MKKYISVLLLATALISSCKSKKQAAASSTTTASTATATATPSEGVALTTSTAGETIGKVSHKYKSTGCSTVILVNKDGTEVTLIPKDKMPSDLDVDGLEIKFNYRVLRMPQPEGCTVGQPAEITDLGKK